MCVYHLCCLDVGNEPTVPPSTTTKKTPENFSSVDLTLPADICEKEYPLFFKARGLEVEVREGEMLYLPAGWYHEVTSFTSTSSTDGSGTSTSSTDGSGSEKMHMAFNYWVHPPDGSSFARPYINDFWPQDWEERKKGGGVPIH